MRFTPQRNATLSGKEEERGEREREARCVRVRGQQTWRKTVIRNENLYRVRERERENSSMLN